MAYIGREPTIGNFQKCDAISVVNGQAAYTLQVGGTNVVPESVNHMLVSLNGILQAPTDSFTVSGSTLTFASNLATGDVIDFVMILGNVLDLGVPSDATVTNAKTNFVSTSSSAGLQIKGDGTTDGTLQLNCSQNSHGIKLKSPPHSASASYTLTFPNNDGDANQFLQTNGSGVLSFADASADFVKIKTIDASDVSSVVMVHGSNDVVFDGTYSQYLLKIMNYVHNGTNDNVQIRVTTDGSSYITSGYNTQTFRAYYSGNTDSYSNYTDSAWRWNFGGNASALTGAAQQADVFISNPTLNNYPDFRGFFWGAEANQALLGMARGRYQTSGTITGFQITQPNGANFTGKFVLYGFKD